MEEYEAQLDESDGEDCREFLKKRITEKLFRRKKYEQLAEKLKGNSEKQISLIDPYVRILQSSKNIFFKNH